MTGRAHRSATRASRSWRSTGPCRSRAPYNADGGRKKHAINEFVPARGGGFLMFLDADDWVPVRLVETVRATMRPEGVGALIETGFVIDFHSLRAAHPRVFDGGFHRVCGSSAVARLRPDHTDPLRRDPWNVLRSHHEWVEVARELGADLARLPVSGSYVTNTSENHSEIHSPYTAWRRTLTECVNREGRQLDGALAAQFGLQLRQIRTASDAFFRAGNGRSEASLPRSPVAGRPARRAASSGNERRSVRNGRLKRRELR